MKKYLLIVISVLLITGCGKKDTMGVFNSVINNEVNNIEMNIKIDAKTSDDKDISMNTNVVTKVEENSQTFIAKIDKNTLTEDITVYGKVVNDKLSLYAPSSILNDNSEYSCTILLDKLIENDISIFKINKLINALNTINEDNIEYIDKKGKEYHYQVKLTDNLLSKMYDEIAGIKEGILKNDILFDIYVNTKTNRVVKIEASEASDLAKLSSDNTFKIVKQLSFTVEFVQYNKVEVEIPNDIIDNALTESTYKQMISLNRN